MKRILIVSIIFLTAGFVNVFAQNNPLDKIFSKYSDADDFTLVVVNRDLFGAMQSMGDSNDKELKQMIENLEFIKILTYEPEGKKKIGLFAEVLNAIEGQGFKELLSVNEKDSKVRFLTKNNDKGKIIEFLMVTAEEDESTVIWIKGEIDLSLLSKLTKGQIDFDNLKK